MDNYHPKDWSTPELMLYLRYEMGWDADKIAQKTRQEMVEIVTKDEIDKE
jgi:hypothetical protein